MGVRSGPEHIVLSDHGACVDVAHQRGPEAWMLVSAAEEPWWAACGPLVERAVEEARHQDVRRIDTALDVASPATGVLLGTLRRHLGREIASLSMRRAGGSAMVTIVLAPPAAREDRAPSVPLAESWDDEVPARRGTSTGRRRPWSGRDAHHARTPRRRRAGHLGRRSGH
jgi:hypothetical protein